MEHCGLYLGSREIGTVSRSIVRGIQHICVDCPLEAGFIYRAVLKTDSGLHPLGVMLPAGDRFLLQREIPAGEVLQCAFIDRSLPEETHLPGLPLALSAFSEATDDDPAAKECFSGKEQLLSARWMEDTFYLYPLAVGEACDFASFFCISRPVLHEGRRYGAFCFRNGRYFPPAETKTDRLCASDALC